jgi:hypothetical protein
MLIDGDRFLGVSCDHVHRAILADDALAKERIHEELGNLDLYPHSRRNDSEQGVQFFALQKTPATVLYNLLPLRRLADFQHIAGEPVDKMGQATGLTIGTLGSMNTEYTCPTSQRVYKRVVEVQWVDDRFAIYGDCGSLYCVKRGGFFIPICIHRVSGERKSYGSHFGDLLEYAYSTSWMFMTLKI